MHCVHRNDVHAISRDYNLHGLLMLHFAFISSLRYFISIILHVRYTYINNLFSRISSLEQFLVRVTFHLYKFPNLRRIKCFEKKKKKEKEINFFKSLKKNINYIQCITKRVEKSFCSTQISGRNNRQ